MKGSLPVPYIVAFIIAVAVIAVAAYLFFNQSNQWQDTALREYCKAKCLECQSLATTGECADQYDEKCPESKTGLDCNLS